MNENKIDFVPDLKVASTAALPRRYESGAFRVTVKNANAELTRDGHPIVSFNLERLDGNGFIELNRMFLEEMPYGKPELSYDITHEFLEFLGFETITQDMFAGTFDVLALNEDLQKHIDAELIVLVHNEYTIKNDTTYVNTKLRMAYDKNGNTKIELERPNLTRCGQLIFAARRMMPTATRSFLDIRGKMPEDKMNMKLLIDEFSHIFSDEELDNFRNGLCGKTSWHKYMK